MFSEMIQNLLNSGGKTAAMQRSAQLSKYMNSMDRKVNQTNIPIPDNSLDTIYPPGNDSVESFKNVLSGTTGKNFGSLLLNSKVLNGNIYENDIDTSSITNSTLMNAINEVNDARKIYNPASANITGHASKSQILDMISQVSQKHGIDEKLVQAVIRQESGFNPNAKSKAGALGLMQLMPSTAKALGVKDPYNPMQNVEGGVKYLKSMLEKYNGNVILALAAYNAGPNAVDKYSGVPPYKETQNYVKNILANYL